MSVSDVRDEWVCAHLHCAVNQDDLIASLVTPVVRRLQRDEIVRQWFYLRYWDGGSHVRLRLLPVTPELSPLVERTVSKYAESYFHGKPTTQAPQSPAYQRIASQLAEAEGLAQYLTTPVPDNAVVFRRYVPEIDRYGVGRSLDAVERHFGESSEIALASLDLSRSMAHRLKLGFLSMVSFMGNREDGPTYARTVGRTLMKPMAELGGGSAIDFEERYQRQRDTLRTLVHFSARSHAPETIVRWIDSIESLEKALATLARTEPESLPPWMGRATGRNQATGYTPLPLLDMCAHLFCNRIGISPVNENYLRFLAARAVSEEVGDPL